MSNASFTRLSGLVAAAGGLILLIIGSVDIITGNPETPQFPLDYLLVLYGFAWAFGLAGFYNLRSYDNLGRAGLGLAFLGALLIGFGAFAMAFLSGDNGWSMWFGGTMLHLVGLSLFGISLWRSHALPQGNLLPLLAGVVPLVLLLALINNYGNWGMLPLLLSGAGWVALGALLVRLSGGSTVPMSPAT